MIEIENDPDWPDSGLEAWAVSKDGRYWMGLSDADARGLCLALNELFGIRIPATLVRTTSGSAPGVAE